MEFMKRGPAVLIVYCQEYITSTLVFVQKLVDDFMKAEEIAGAEELIRRREEADDSIKQVNKVEITEEEEPGDLDPEIEILMAEYNIGTEVTSQDEKFATIE
jgi:hypothetical protein